jgi:hypothetical protein
VDIRAPSPFTSLIVNSLQKNLYNPTTPSLLLNAHITNFPKSRRSRWSMNIKVLIKPIAQDPARGFETAYLNALGAPPLFAVEDAE